MQFPKIKSIRNLVLQVNPCASSNLCAALVTSDLIISNPYLFQLCVSNTKSSDRVYLTMPCRNKVNAYESHNEPNSSAKAGLLSLLWSSWI